MTGEDESAPIILQSSRMTDPELLSKALAVARVDPRWAFSLHSFVSNMLTFILHLSSTA